MTLLEFSRLLSRTDAAVSLAAWTVPDGMYVALELTGPIGHRSVLLGLRNGEHHQGQRLEDAVLHAIGEIRGPAADRGRPGDVPKPCAVG